MCCSDESTSQASLAACVTTVVKPATARPRNSHRYSTPLQFKVDTTRGERLHLTFNLTFPALPCELLMLDVQDVAGTFEVGISEVVGACV